MFSLRLAIYLLSLRMTGRNEWCEVELVTDIPLLYLDPLFDSALLVFPELGPFVELKMVLRLTRKNCWCEVVR